jgi:uncharacterized membrane protein
MRHSFPVRRTIFDHSVQTAAPLFRGAGAVVVQSEEEKTAERNKAIATYAVYAGAGTLLTGLAIYASFTSPVVMMGIGAASFVAGAAYMATSKSDETKVAY